MNEIKIAHWPLGTEFTGYGPDDQDTCGGIFRGDGPVLTCDQCGAKLRVQRRKEDEHVGYLVRARRTRRAL